MTSPARATHSFPELLKELTRFALGALSAEALMEQIASRLHAEMTRYNWVGFYLVDRTGPEVLVLGPFHGSFTPYERIAFGEGLCGAAAAAGQTVVVNDVNTDSRYMPGGAGQTKSEIVVPIFARGKLWGELDVNSYFSATFTREDRRFVEDCAALVGKFVEQHPV